MPDLSKLELSDILTLGATLRSPGSAGQNSMEAIASGVVDVLFQRLVRGGGGGPALALARVYKTHAYSELEPDLQAFACDILGGTAPAPETKCLVLLATRGTEPAWNDRRKSTGHRAIPLPDPEFVARLPMVAEVLRQFGLSAQAVLRPDPGMIAAMERRQFDVFLVPQARGASCIPAQDDFVVRCGIESVLAFGGGLPNGDLFVSILFSRVPITREIGDMFAPLALSVKLSLISGTSRSLLAKEGSQ
jgi:hypothetical protein